MFFSYEIIRHIKQRATVENRQNIHTHTHTHTHTHININLNQAPPAVLLRRWSADRAVMMVLTTFSHINRNLALM
jgi:hypothetical protein